MSTCCSHGDNTKDNATIKIKAVSPQMMAVSPQEERGQDDKVHPICQPAALMATTTRTTPSTALLYKRSKTSGAQHAICQPARITPTAYYKRGQDDRAGNLAAMYCSRSSSSALAINPAPGTGQFQHWQQSGVNSFILNEVFA